MSIIKLYFYRYLLNTCKYHIVYDRLSNKSVIAHFNSDWAQDSKSHKFITDYFTLIAYKVISWISYQQITLSSTKVKYITFFNRGHQLI